MKPGDTLGKYRIESLIAVGGMAEVWLATARGVGGFKKRVVLKFILPQLAEHPEFVSMFINEALLAAKLNHPNIVQIFDLGQVGGSYYIAMEHVVGRTLRQISRACRKRGHLIPPWFVLHVTKAVAEGLQYAHEYSEDSGGPLGLVHRDVTPENIMISFTGAVKLLDFGVAKATQAPSLTQAGTIKGKYAYLSPEQARGVPADRRCDIYAVGVILYELLTGVRPFWGENDLALLRMVSEGNPEPPRAVAPWIPEEIESIILRALTYDPGQRYSEAGKLEEDVVEYLRRCRDRHVRRDMGHFVSELFAGEPDIPNDVAKRMARQTGLGREELPGVFGALRPGSQPGSEPSTAAPGEPDRSPGAPLPGGPLEEHKTSDFDDSGYNNLEVSDEPVPSPVPQSVLGDVISYYSAIDFEVLESSSRRPEDEAVEGPAEPPHEGSFAASPAVLPGEDVPDEATTPSGVSLDQATRAAADAGPARAPSGEGEDSSTAEHAKVPEEGAAPPAAPPRQGAGPDPQLQSEPAVPADRPPAAETGPDVAPPAATVKKPEIKATARGYAAPPLAAPRTHVPGPAARVGQAAPTAASGAAPGPQEPDAALAPSSQESPPGEAASPAPGDHHAQEAVRRVWKLPGPGPAAAPGMARESEPEAPGSPPAEPEARAPVPAGPPGSATARASGPAGSPARRLPSWGLSGPRSSPAAGKPEERAPLPQEPLETPSPQAPALREPQDHLAPWAARSPGAQAREDEAAPAERSGDRPGEAGGAGEKGQADPPESPEPEAPSPLQPGPRERSTDTLVSLWDSSRSRRPRPGQDPMAALWASASAARSRAEEGGGPELLRTPAPAAAPLPPAPAAPLSAGATAPGFHPPSEPDIHSPPGFTTRAGQEEPDALSPSRFPPGEGAEGVEPGSPDIFLSRRRRLSRDSDEDIFTAYHRSARSAGRRAEPKNPFAAAPAREPRPSPGSPADPGPAASRAPAFAGRSRTSDDPKEQAARCFEAGLGHLSRGEREQARQQWEQAVSLDPDTRLYQMNLRRLEKISDPDYFDGARSFWGGDETKETE